MSGHVTWPAVVLMGLGVFQTVALAHIASRSRRVRRTDKKPPQGP